jgi:DNA-binding CsgD family transcriptional regulator
MYETDRISDLLTAERRGKIQGRAEGEAEVIALLAQGLSLEEIKQRLSKK